MSWSSRASGLAVVLVALGLSAAQTQAQSLGRLFTTPEQRSALDEIRVQAQFEEPAPEPEPAPRAAVTTEAKEPVVSKLTINGIVRRSGGRTSVWVNGDEIERGSRTREGVAVDAARADLVRLRLPSGTQSIALRPGQAIDVRSGLVLDAYEHNPSAGRQTAFPAASSSSGGPDSAPIPAAGETSASPTSGASTPQNPLTAEVLQQIEALAAAAKSAAGVGAAPPPK